MKGIESVGIRGTKLSKWDSLSVHNYRFLITDVLCSLFMSRNPLGQIHHKFFMGRGRAGDFSSPGCFVRRGVTLESLIFVLLATPNLQLLLRAGPKIIPTFPYEILLKNVGPHALCTKPNYFWNVPWNSGIQIGIKETAQHLFPLSVQSVD